MKIISTLLCSICVLSLFYGCNITRGSHVIVGIERAPIDASNVKIYTRPPAKYEEIAIISTDARNAFASAQSLMDSAIARLKKEAAKLGANGILLTGAGDQYGGSVGSGFGTANAFGTGSGTTAFGSGFGSSSAILNKATSGIAIYVIQE